MKKIYNMTILIIIAILLVGCSNIKEEYDGYINGVRYNVGDELNIEVNLKTDDSNILVCPIIKIEQDGENEDTKISDSIEFSAENIEFLNLSAKEFSEVYNDNYWSLQTSLSNNEEKIDFVNGNPIVKIKIIIKEKGNYKISIEENEEKCNKRYKEALSISINK